MADTLVDVSNLQRITRDEAFDLAATAYDRYVGVLEGLGEQEWHARTECPDWDVRQMAVHVLGACDSCISPAETVHQFAKGAKWARAHDRDFIDGINAVQVADRDHLQPDQVLADLRRQTPRAVAWRKRLSRAMGPMPVPNGSGGWMNLAHLMEVLYTRDAWMHRVDTLRAVGHPEQVEVTRSHDGRLVEDVVAQWARQHGQPFTLRLTGPAGGAFRQGSGGPEHELDAVEFMRLASGRAPADGSTATGLLAETVIF